MQNTEEIKGITIVSLVVTIVVLLILAGVTVSVLFGNNGVVDNVKDRQDSAYSKIAHEEVKKLTMEYDVANSGETLEEFLIDKVQEGRIEEVTRKDDKTLIVKKNGYEIEVESENRIFIIEAEPYVGTYDGKSHDVLTSVSVSPSDAKIEYSTNGTTYSTTMPTITNTSSFTVTVRASKAGYKTQSTTQTVKVNKAAGTLTLSATSGTLMYPNTTTFTVSGNKGTLSVASSNTNVATASISGNTVIVKSGSTAGMTTITVKSAASTNYNEKTATYTVTVKNPTFTADSGVGYYADTDGDGTPDGIIFEDFKKGGSGSWGGTNYTISTVTGLKEYYVSKTNYNGPFGTKNVLSARGSGNARFYVIALNDYNNGTKEEAVYVKYNKTINSKDVKTKEDLGEQFIDWYLILEEKDGKE